VLVTGALLKGEEQTKTLIELAQLASYSWEEPELETEKEIDELAAENTVLGLNDQHEWKIAA